MVNQLSIPFKKTYPVEIKEAVRNYIHTYSDTHPDAFKWDINRWQALRKDGVGGSVHVDRIPAILSYHAQLLSILTKLPTDIGLEIAYAPVFTPTGVPITLKNLAYERTSLLFNFASLFSQLAASEDRSKQEGLKRARVYYQNAAGTLAFMISSALPKLVFSPDDEEIPLDLCEPFIHALQWLMRAQAQECAWQMATLLSSFKNGVIAKLAAQAADLYRSSAATIRDASPPVKHLFPSDWISHIETKHLHFEAVAQYRKSIDELEANRYGHELARLYQAQVDAKKGHDIARRNNVSAAVLLDIKSLLDEVQKNIKRAERDNDLIYHQDVPAITALSPVGLQGAMMGEAIVPPGLLSPIGVIGSEAPLFAELQSWGVREAINIYNDHKQNLIQEKIIDAARELDDRADKTLRSLNLPSALEALERPVGLPPSLLKKAEEVRLEAGPAKIEAFIENVQKLSQHDISILDEAMDILDAEASEDEATRKGTPLDRPPSYEANQELIEKEKRYRSILEQAAASDEIVRQKWDQWERNIVELTWDEAELEASVPSSTVSRSSSTSVTETQTHARALRVLLEALDHLSRTRAQYVERAQRLGEADDITRLIMQKATGFQKLTEVEPAMFEDVMDAELGKYDKFVRGVEETEGKMEDLLEKTKERNVSFLQSRKDDPSVKERELALQSLDLAYHKYREIERNLDEGLKFYNHLAEIFVQFKESCRTWSNDRKQEIPNLLSRSVNSISLRDIDREGPVKSPADLKYVAPSPVPPQAVSPPRLNKQSGISSFGLPRPDSEEWESMPLPLPPPSSVRKAL